MEYREKKFKSGGEKGKKNWKKENAGRNGNNGRDVNGKTERNSGRKETQNFVSGTEKRNGRNYGNQDKSVEKKLGYIDEKLEKKYNKDIILKKIIDPEILGGIYVRIGNDVIDGTVRTRLDDLRKLMLTTE